MHTIKTSLSSGRAWEGLLLLFLLSLLPSCENHIYLPEDYDEPRLTLNAYVDVSDTASEQYLSVSLTDAHEPRHLKDARVFISIDGGPLEQALPDEYTGVYHFPRRLGEGGRLHIEASTADGRYSATVDEVAPMPPTLSAFSVDTLQAPGHVRSEREALPVNVHFTEPANSEKRYYRLVMRRDIESLYLHHRYWYDEGWRTDTSRVDFSQRAFGTDYAADADPIINEGHRDQSDADYDITTIQNVKNQQGVFSNRLFAGRPCTLTVLDTYSSTFPPYKRYEEEDYGYSREYAESIHHVTLHVALQSLSPTSYFYFRALNTFDSDAYDDNSDLSGPLRFPSNVQGGAGIVILAASRSVTLPLW